MKKRLLSALVLLSLLSIPAISQEQKEETAVVVDEQAQKTQVDSSSVAISESALDTPQVEKAPAVKWFTPGPAFSLALREKAYNYHNFSLYTLGLGVIGQMNFDELFVKTGFDFTIGQTNFTVDAAYSPTFFGLFQVGVRFIYHIDWYHSSYYLYDMLPGIYASFKPVYWFKMSFSGFYQQTGTHVYSLANSCPWIISNCPAFELKFDFFPLDWLSASLSISSFSFFKYFLFLSPNLRLSATFKTNEHFFMQITGEGQAVDFFTLSANFNSLSASVSAIWRF